MAPSATSRANSPYQSLASSAVPGGSHAKGYPLDRRRCRSRSVRKRSSKSPLIAGEELLVLGCIVDIDDEPEQFVFVAGSFMHPNAEDGMRQEAHGTELDDQVFCVCSNASPLTKRPSLCFNGKRIETLAPSPGISG